MISNGQRIERSIASWAKITIGLIFVMSELLALIAFSTTL